MSSSIRIASFVGFVALSLWSVACVAPVPGTSESDKSVSGNNNSGIVTAPSKSGTGTGTAQASDGVQSAGTCDGVCSHILECKGLEDSSANHKACVTNCTSMKVSSSDLAQVARMDCETLLKLDNNPQPTSSSSGGSSGTTTSTKGKECDGCVSDGAGACMWGSQGNWGSSGYSGAVSECNAYCCE